MTESEPIRTDQVGAHTQVPAEAYKAILNIRNGMENTNSVEIAGVIFGQNFTPGEARFVLAYCSEASLEKIFEREQTDENSNAYWAAVDLRESVERAYKEQSFDHLPSLVEQYFQNPVNKLRIGFLAKGVNFTGKE